MAQWQSGLMRKTRIRGSQSHRYLISSEASVRTRPASLLPFGQRSCSVRAFGIIFLVNYSPQEIVLSWGYNGG